MFLFYSLSSQLKLAMSGKASYVNHNGCCNIDGGGWLLVRRVASPNQWHPTFDNGTGTQASYGMPSYIDNINNTIDVQGNSTWSFEYSDSTIVTWNQFLFATGDCSKWLVTTPSQVNGEYYNNQDRCILSSSQSGEPYYTKWYFRSKGSPQDPLISINDSGYILYSEAYSIFNTLVLQYGGANVWIRNAKNDTRDCKHINNSTIFPSAFSNLTYESTHC